jgi:hypothetical protein
MLARRSHWNDSSVLFLMTGCQTLVPIGRKVDIVRGAGDAIRRPTACRLETCLPTVVTWYHREGVAKNDSKC